MNEKVIIFALVALLVVASAQAQIPTQIEDPRGGPPIWIAAEAACDADGSLLWHKIPKSEHFWIEKIIEGNRKLRRERVERSDATANGCQTYRQSTSGLSLSATRFSTFLEASKLAVVGRVRSVAEGFYRGQVTAVIQLDVDRVLRQSVPGPPIDSLYFLFSHATVAAEGELLCVRNRHYPDRPEVGLRVLVFADTIAERDPLILNPHSSAVIFERADGSLSLGWDRSEAVSDPPGWASIEKQLKKEKISAPLSPAAPRQ